MLWELSNEGHTCEPGDKLIQNPRKRLLDNPRCSLLNRAFRAFGQRKSDYEKRRFAVWVLAPLSVLKWELRVSWPGLRGSACALRQGPDLKRRLNGWQAKLKIELATLAAPRRRCCPFQKRFLILTGGPGTGKSTITQGDSRNQKKSSPSKILLAAPTGRAAKRMTEISGKKGLDNPQSARDGFWRTHKFKRGRDNPLDAI